MALTLPYPDMDFTPLDVLTAAEMDQIVSNYEYIANQFPVKSSNIDLTTLVQVITAQSVISSEHTSKINADLNSIVKIMNKVVVISIALNNITVTSNTTLTIGVLPTGWRPTNNVAGLAFFDGVNQYTGAFWVSSYGQMNVRFQYNYTGNLRISVCLPISRT